MLEPDFLVQFAEERVLGPLIALHATLRKLPAAAVAPTAEEQLAAVAHQDDADIGAKALAVDVVAHGSGMVTGG